MKNSILLFSVITVLCSCGNHKEKSKDPAQADTTVKVVPPTPDRDGLNQQDSIKATGRQVLTLMKNRNYAELAKYFANEGVLFSPYGYIDTAQHKKLSPSDFLESVQKKWVLTWGSFDGTGDPIKLTVSDYFKKFVYHADYLNAEAVGYDEIIKKGNTQINLQEIFPKHHFIDYHFSGFDQMLEGMDWESLRLVFEKQDGQYFLVAVIHDQWTV